MAQREALLGIAVGKKGVGKTYTTLEIISSYLRGNKKTGAKPRKVLILDVNNEFGDVKGDHKNPNFPHIKAMKLEHVKQFTYSSKIEARRISILKEGGGKMNLTEISEALSYILNNYENGLLLIEDITKFISDSLPGDLVGAICTQRHVSVDVICHFQTIGKAGNPKLWGNCNYLRFHACEDTVARHKDKFPGSVDALLIAENLVNYKVDGGNPRFHCYYDKDYGTIKGDFTLNDFKATIEKMLQDNYTMVKKEADRRNIYTGEKVYKSQKEATSKLIQKYIDTYYGNQKR